MFWHEILGKNDNDTTKKIHQIWRKLLPNTLIIGCA